VTLHQGPISLLKKHVPPKLSEKSVGGSTNTAVTPQAFCYSASVLCLLKPEEECQERGDEGEEGASTVVALVVRAVRADGGVREVVTRAGATSASFEFGVQDPVISFSGHEARDTAKRSFRAGNQTLGGQIVARELKDGSGVGVAVIRTRRVAVKAFSCNYILASWAGSAPIRHCVVRNRGVRPVAHGSSRIHDGAVDRGISITDGRRSSPDAGVVGVGGSGKR